MSRAPHDASDIRNAGIGGDQYPPQSAPNQASHGVSNFVDGSGPIFSMYLEMATEEDKKMVEGWKADADGILVFTGLFSAAVASLISVSIQDIRPNPQDTSNFYLANIYQTLADPGSNISASLPASPPPFSPPNYAVWVNTLLFLSLVISISCALLATLLQQWARRYLKVTQTRYSLHKRARIRTFFFEGVEKFLLPWAVEALPTLLHISLFLFFTGISVFLWNVNLTMFKSAVSWIGICTALYGCITFLPIFRHDSPYHTPLSLPAWHIITGIQFVTFWVLHLFTLSAFICFQHFCIEHSFLRRFADKAYNYFGSLEESYQNLLSQGMQKTMEKTALNSPSEIDTRAFLWTFDSLDEDHELERFFSGLPGFRSSKVVKDPLPLLTWEQKEKLSVGLNGLFDRTFSSDLLPESVKNWRAIICARALDPALFSYEYGQLMNTIMFKYECMGLQTSKFGCIVRGWGNGGNQGTGLVIQAIVTNIVATSKQRDDSWFILASSELRVAETVLRDYAVNGNSLPLAVLIHVVRQQFNHSGESFWPSVSFRYVLEAASGFDVRDTPPELQNEFCALWNQVVLKAQKDDDRRMVSRILEPICSIYVSLHHGTDSAPTRLSHNPSSYPLCAVLHHNPEFVAAISAPEALSSSPPSPLCVIESFTDEPLLDNFHHAHRSTIESIRIPVASSTLATASALQDTVNSGITTPNPIPETSTSPPLFPTSSPAVVSLSKNPETLMASGIPNVPPSASSGRGLDNILLTGPCHLTIATAAPTASLGLTSAPNLGAAIEGDNSQEPGLCNNKDALGPPSVNQAIYAKPIDLPSQPPSLPSVTDSDVVITIPSMWEPNTEHRGGHPPDPSHGQYNIV